MFEKKLIHYMKNVYHIKNGLKKYQNKKHSQIMIVTCYVSTLILYQINMIISKVSKKH